MLQGNFAIDCGDLGSSDLAPAVAISGVLVAPQGESAGYRHGVRDGGAVVDVVPQECRQTPLFLSGQVALLLALQLLHAQLHHL